MWCCKQVAASMTAREWASSRPIPEPLAPTNLGILAGIRNNVSIPASIAQVGAP